MVRHTNADEADVDVTEWSTDRLADYINRIAPVAANVPDGEYADAVLTANARVAIAEFRDRHGIDDTDHLTGDDREPTDAEVAFGESVDAFEDAVAGAVTDGGEDPVEAIVDDEFGDGEHYLRHVTDDTYDHKIRHDGSIRTRAEDGYVVHKIVEQYDDAADADSLSWSGVPRCPIHGSDHRDRELEDDGDVQIKRWSCDGDDGACPFTAAQAEPRAKSPDYEDGVTYGEAAYERPLWFRATEPHDFEAEKDDFDATKFSEWVEDGDDVDAEDLANALRSMKVTNKGMIADGAYVSAEYDGNPVDGDKVADAYVDTFECARCGDTRDAGAERSHPAHDDPVCRDCEDDPEWSIDDADLPDDVEDMFDAYASVTPSKVVAYLRDVRYWREYIAATVDKKDDPSGMFTIDTTPDDVDVDEVPACPTGKQGERRVQGHGSPGTGFRRPDGAAHGDSNWRVVLREARDAGLIERVDDEDVDFDAPKARWETTDKGDRVFDELSRCEWCGARKTGHLWKHTYKVSRWNTATDYDLITRCPDACRDSRKGTTVDLSEY